MTKDMLIEQLRLSGYKITEQRSLVLDALYANKGHLMSADALLGWVRQYHKKTNMTTVYRNLEALLALNAIHKTLLDDQVTYYQLTCSNHHHHHLICKSCGRVEAIGYCPLAELGPLAKDLGFTISSHKLEVYGMCKACKHS